MLPSRSEISRRIHHGISMREAELWLAEEFENMAALLRKVETRESTIEEMHTCVRSIKNTIDIVVGCVPNPR